MSWEDGGPTSLPKSFDTWFCTFAAFEGGKEVLRARHVNVIYGAESPPKEIQSNGNKYILCEADLAQLTAWYDASHIVAGLTFEECEARRIARRLIGVR